MKTIIAEIDWRGGAYICNPKKYSANDRALCDGLGIHMNPMFV